MVGPLKQLFFGRIYAGFWRRPTQLRQAALANTAPHGSALLALSCHARLRLTHTGPHTTGWDQAWVGSVDLQAACPPFDQNRPEGVLEGAILPGLIWANRTRDLLIFFMEFSKLICARLPGDKPHISQRSYTSSPFSRNCSPSYSQKFACSWLKSYL